MKLSELKTGEKGFIVKVQGHGGFRKRIIEMGFIRGQEVEVLPKSGAKLKGILVSADEKGFVIKTTQKQKTEGSKRPKAVEVEMPFSHDEVKYVKYVISLK